MCEAGTMVRNGMLREPRQSIRNGRPRDSNNTGQNQWDISLLKNVAMTERVRMQFRAEFFNAFNRPQYFSPNVTFTIPANNVIGGTTPNASFGKISQAGDARQIQLGLKLYY